MAEEDAEVGEHAGDVRGADDGAAVGADHGVLKTARAGCGIDAEHAAAVEQRDGGAEECGLEQEGDAVAPPELKCAVLHEEAADDVAGDERADDGGKMEGGFDIERCERGGEHGCGAGEVRDGLMLKAEEPDDVDHAADKRERPCSRPDPAWQLGNHRVPAGGKPVSAFLIVPLF